MDRSIRVLIVDDEVLGRERIHFLLTQSEGVEVIGECHDGVEALEVIQRRSPDVVFLDVQMPELSGLDVVAALAPEQCPQVVFVTAYDAYMQRAFEVHASITCASRSPTAASTMRSSTHATGSRSGAAIRRCTRVHWPCWPISTGDRSAPRSA